MAVSMQQVRDALAADEVNYPAVARLGAEALPYLAELVGGDDVGLAAKATYLASLIPGPGQAEIIERASSSPEAAIRVSAAVSVNGLSEEVAAQTIVRLLEDDDVGVRKHAAVSAGRLAGSSGIRERLERLRDSDDSDAVRSRAEQSLTGR
jgi:HEAT repeat protein